MACKYARKDSPYWWIKYGDEFGKTRFSSTGFRLEIPQETRRADKLVEKHTELEKRNRESSPNAGAEFTAWVPDFLESRYSSTPVTLEAYRCRWRCISSFLKSDHIRYPRQVAYDHAWKYVAWRKKGSPKQGVRSSCHNTALMEVKLWGLLMTQAVRRGYCESNPLNRPGIPKEKPDRKPSMTDEEIQRIWTELKRWPQWMQVCFEIALYSGCRLSETNIPLGDVDLESGIMTFKNPKGGVERGFTVPIRDELIPLFVRLKSERGSDRRAYDFEATGSEWEKPSKMWWRFFKQNPQLDLPHLCFHCTRVTFITRGAQQGIPEAKMMKLVNHASEEIHRVYQRLGVADVRQELNAIKLPLLNTSPSTHEAAGVRIRGVRRPQL